MKLDLEVVEDVAQMVMTTSAIGALLSIPLQSGLLLISSLMLALVTFVLLMFSAYALWLREDNTSSRSA